MLRALLQSRGAQEWRQALTEDLTVLRKAMEDKLDALPLPALCLAPWCDLVRQHPGAWKALLKRFRQLSVEDSRVDELVQRVVRPAGAPRPEADPQVCYDCGYACNSRKALLLHRRQVHAQRSPGFQYVLDGRCPACAGWFHSRLRALHHLEWRSAPCRAKLDAGLLEPLPDDVLAAVDALDAEHRRKCHRTGERPLTGPPALPSGPAAD